ncbi:thioredoxin family protein [Adlercreutzia equolifaciens]|jgi:thioredoxin 1|uniref:thioredoxin family protein n=1 Tax=Adlercreutzia equolifaciens TaxID=446660 RepID=UPI0027B92B91|nr:thioredoxin family protein [Adlercreutzia equolifaciens]MEE0345021.1 thioredoxin family protein [Adlercreutzia sp.]MEE0582250.1 thioredoxin family protein [Adlercreutzia sp.]
MVELTKENFDARVTNAEGTVLVDFWSPGCGPCRAMEPVLEAVAARHPEVRFAKLNAAEHPDIAWAFKVVSVPTLVLFRDGVPVDDIVGAVPAQRIEDLLAKGGREGGGA